MTRCLLHRLTCLAALAALVGGTAVISSARDDPPKTKKKAPPKADPDDDVIVPGKKKIPPKGDDDDDVVVPGKKTRTPAGGRSLDDLLKQANLQYETVEGKDGAVGYKIPVTVKGQKTTVFAQELLLGKSSDGQEVRAVIVGSPVASFPTGYRASLPLYKTVSEFNDGFLFGKGLVSPQGVGYFCPFWLRNADAQTLLDHLYMAHLGRLELKKRVQPVMEEEE